MFFNLTWEAILEIVERRVLHTRMARGVVRKSGFRVGTVQSQDVAPILSIPPVEPEPSVGLYWHPANLPHYITKRSLSFATEVRVSVPVMAASLDSSATLGAVYSPTHSTTLGDWETLASVDFTEPGFYVSDWASIPPEARLGEIYIGMFIEIHSPGVLSLGQAEVRIR